jgi:ubiquinone biosynthesis protein UbiJ
MDRRTSCLQSNVEFLQQTVNKNTLEAQQKLAAATREITALKEALASLQARVDQLQKVQGQ